MEITQTYIIFGCNLALIILASLIKKIHLSHTELILYSNDILEIRLSNDFYYTIAEAKQISKAIDDISEGAKRKVILEAGTYSLCDDETRKFISSVEICNKIKAMALIPKSLAQDLLAKFIINFDRPSVPGKVFRSKEKAINWLQSF